MQRVSEQMILKSMKDQKQSGERNGYFDALLIRDYSANALTNVKWVFLDGSSVFGWEDCDTVVSLWCVFSI